MGSLTDLFGVWSWQAIRLWVVSCILSRGQHLLWVWWCSNALLTKLTLREKIRKFLIILAHKTPCHFSGWTALIDVLELFASFYYLRNIASEGFVEELKTSLLYSLWDTKLTKNEPHMAWLLNLLTQLSEIRTAFWESQLQCARATCKWSACTCMNGLFYNSHDCWTIVWQAVKSRGVNII